MTYSQDKLAWTNIALRWKFLQCSTAPWRDPCFIWETQNRISITNCHTCLSHTHTTLTAALHEVVKLSWILQLQPDLQHGWEWELTVLYHEIISTQTFPSCFIVFEKRSILIFTAISNSFCDIYRSRSNLAARQRCLYDTSVALHLTAELPKDRRWSLDSDCSCCGTHSGLQDLCGNRSNKKI